MFELPKEAEKQKYQSMTFNDLLAEFNSSSNQHYLSDDKHLRCIDKLIEWGLHEIFFTNIVYITLFAKSAFQESTAIILFIEKIMSQSVLPNLLSLRDLCELLSCVVSGKNLELLAAIDRASRGKIQQLTNTGFDALMLTKMINAPRLPEFIGAYPFVQTQIETLDRRAIESALENYPLHKNFIVTKGQSLEGELLPEEQIKLVESPSLEKRPIAEAIETNSIPKEFIGLKEAVEDLKNKGVHAKAESRCRAVEVLASIAEYMDGPARYQSQIYYLLSLGYDLSLLYDLCKKRNPNHVFCQWFDKPENKLSYHLLQAAEAQGAPSEEYLKKIEFSEPPANPFYFLALLRFDVSRKPGVLEKIVNADGENKQSIWNFVENNPDIKISPSEYYRLLFKNTKRDTQRLLLKNKALGDINIDELFNLISYLPKVQLSDLIMLLLSQCLTGKVIVVNRLEDLERLISIISSVMKADNAKLPGLKDKMQFSYQLAKFFKVEISQEQLLDLLESCQQDTIKQLIVCQLGMQVLSNMSQEKLSLLDPILQAENRFFLGLFPEKFLSEREFVEYFLWINDYSGQLLFLTGARKFLGKTPGELSLDCLTAIANEVTKYPDGPQQLLTLMSLEYPEVEEKPIYLSYCCTQAMLNLVSALKGDNKLQFARALIRFVPLGSQPVQFDLKKDINQEQFCEHRLPHAIQLLYFSLFFGRLFYQADNELLEKSMAWFEQQFPEHASSRKNLLAALGFDHDNEQERDRALETMALLPRIMVLKELLAQLPADSADRVALVKKHLPMPFAALYVHTASCYLLLKQVPLLQLHQLNFSYCMNNETVKEIVPLTEHWLLLLLASESSSLRGLINYVEGELALDWLPYVSSLEPIPLLALLDVLQTKEIIFSLQEGCITKEDDIIGPEHRPNEWAGVRGDVKSLKQLKVEKLYALSLAQLTSANSLKITTEIAGVIKRVLTQFTNALRLSHREAEYQTDYLDFYVKGFNEKDASLAYAGRCWRPKNVFNLFGLDIFSQLNAAVSLWASYALYFLAVLDKFFIANAMANFKIVLDGVSYSSLDAQTRKDMVYADYVYYQFALLNMNSLSDQGKPELALQLRWFVLYSQYYDFVRNPVPSLERALVLLQEIRIKNKSISEANSQKEVVDRLFVATAPGQGFSRVKKYAEYAPPSLKNTTSLAMLFNMLHALIIKVLIGEIEMKATDNVASLIFAFQRVNQLKNEKAVLAAKQKAALEALPGAQPTSSAVPSIKGAAHKANKVFRRLFTGKKSGEPQSDNIQNQPEFAEAEPIMHSNDDKDEVGNGLSSSSVVEAEVFSEATAAAAFVSASVFPFDSHVDPSVASALAVAMPSPSAQDSAAVVISDGVGKSDLAGPDHPSWSAQRPEALECVYPIVEAALVSDKQDVSTAEQSAVVATAPPIEHMFSNTDTDVSSNIFKQASEAALLFLSPVNSPFVCYTMELNPGDKVQEWGSLSP